MTTDPITQFELDPDLFTVIRKCTEHYDVGDPGAEWPNNIISREAVVFGSGVIARRGAQVRHAVDPEELSRCRRLAAAAAAVMAGVSVGMGSASDATFRPFFIAANIDEAVPTSIDESLIRQKFGGTLFPPVTITTEPLKEAGKWWSEVEADGEESEDSYFDPWKAMIRWFHAQPELVTSAFVRIGYNRDLWKLPKEQWPKGTELTGCVLPRLALGLARQGSLIGLFGHAVTK